MGMQAITHSTTHHSVLNDLALEGGPLERVLQVMNLLAVSGAGLGEVLPDYAQQTGAQMEELMQAAGRCAHGQCDAQVEATLKNTYNVLSSAATVLEMTPAAMQRNKAEAIGTREKMSREEVVRVTRAFRHDPELQLLMASEDSCSALMQQAMANASYAAHTT